MKLIFSRTINYLKYLLFWRHQGGHGVHSPFVFDLVSRIFRNKISPDIVSKIENVRKKMISDRRLLEVRDMGSGSLKAKTGLTSLEKIARYSPVPQKYGILLANMASEFGKPFIIEFGTSVGISTMYLASGTGAPVYTMEGSQDISDIAIENFREEGYDNIRVLTGSFEELLPSIMDLPGNPGLIFIDGNHRKEPVINYFSKMIKISGNDTVIIFDDIRYSEEMEEAWEIIKKDERVTMTIDIWRMGIVFFREGVSCGNFKIRY